MTACSPSSPPTAWSTRRSTARCPRPSSTATLFEDTASADLTFHGAADGRTADGKPLAIWYFRFDWTLRSGGEVIGADMVDISELDGAGKIASLTIVYDTHDARPVFRAATGR